MSEIQEAKWYVVHTYSGHENKKFSAIQNNCMYGMLWALCDISIFVC